MPFFDKNGNMVDADKINLDDDFPKLQDLDELPKIKGKKLFSLMGKMSTTSMVLASVRGRASYCCRCARTENKLLEQGSYAFVKRKQTVRGPSDKV